MKNFNRRIEQMMNETAVTPPYVMWNRISSELPSEITPPVAAPTSVIPGRAIISLVAGSMIVGATLLTNYLFNKDVVVHPKSFNQAESATNISAQKNVETIVALETKRSNSISSIKRSLDFKPVLMRKMEKPIMDREHFQNNLDVVVPNQKVTESAVTNDTYYFPPVDIDVPEAKNTESASIATKPDKPNEDETKLTEKRIRPALFGGEKRIKFRKRRVRDFSFGRINRLKRPN